MGGSAFWHGTAFDQSYTVLRKFRLFTKIRVLLLDFFLNSALIKCRHGTSFVECAINLLEKGGDAQSVRNCTVVCQLS